MLEPAPTCAIMLKITFDAHNLIFSTIVKRPEQICQCQRIGETTLLTTATHPWNQHDEFLE